MEISTKFLLFSTTIILFSTIAAQSAAPCKIRSCLRNRGPIIRFPFRLIDRQPVQCGYPGFELRCNSRGETVLTLPDSNEFVVFDIDYLSSAIYIEDPLSCAYDNFSLAGSPFRFYSMSNYNLFNCSGAKAGYAVSRAYISVPCYGDSFNETVVAAIRGWPAPPMCRWMANVTVPSGWPYEWWREPAGAGPVKLTWSEPACKKCELRGGFCGYKSDSGREIGCYGSSSSSSSSSSSGIPRGVKYAIAVGVGIPTLICIIALVLYKIRFFRFRHYRNSQFPTMMISNESRAITGLDQPTIESYPMMVLGESRRLPNPNNGTCPICLCDYKPNDTLKSIPKCNHYFHVDCVDEWLRLNGTCPVCRSSPASSSEGTPVSLTSLPSLVSLATSIER